MDQPLVTVPPSKSETHRALIIAAMAGGSVIGASHASDCKATLQVLHDAGAKLAIDNQMISFLPAPFRPITAADAHNSGSTFRLLAPLLGHPTGTHWTGDNSLRGRQMHEAANFWRQFGITMNGMNLPAVVQGQFQPGSGYYEGKSSQPLSGICLAAAHKQEPTSIAIPGNSPSRGYVDLTLQMLADAGCAIAISGSARNSITISRGNMTPSKFTVGGDWSAAAFPCMLAALSDRQVSIAGLQQGSRQPDASLPQLLDQFGCQNDWKDDKFTVHSGPEQFAKIDLSGNPDLAPLAFALGSKTGAVIRGFEGLANKESNRLQVLCDAFAAQLKNDEITVAPETNLEQTYQLLQKHTDAISHDHRMGMLAWTIAAVLQKPLPQIDAGASWPTFERDMQSVIHGD